MSIEFKDYYKVLGVDPEASKKDIKTAYRKLARKYHPDVSDNHQAEDKFKEVSEAYEVLKNAEKRAEYDEIRRYGTHGQSFKPPPGWQPRHSDDSYSSQQNFSEFFSSIFGQDFDSQNFTNTQSNTQQHFTGGQSAHRTSQQRGQDIEKSFQKLGRRLYHGWAFGPWGRFRGP